MPFELKATDIISVISILSSIFVGVAVIIATYKGPVRASQDADQRRANSEIISRKMNVFRMLMGHRYDLFNPAFVEGLNLVQIEFHGSPTVIQEYKRFLHEFRDRAHESNQDAVLKDRSDAITRLIVAIGKDLNYELDPLSLLNESYSPTLWRTDSDKQAAIRDMMHDIAVGKRAFPVMNFIADKFVSESEDGKLAFRTKNVDQ